MGRTLDVERRAMEFAEKAKKAERERRSGRKLSKASVFRVFRFLNLFIKKEKEGESTNVLLTIFNLLCKNTSHVVCMQ